MSLDRLGPLLDAVRRRWRAQGLLCAGGRAGVAASVPILAAVVIASLVDFSDRALVVLGVSTVAAAVLAAVVAAFYAGIVRLIRRAPDRQIARYIEERAAAIARSVEKAGGPAVPAFDDVLVSAVGEKTGSSGFHALVVASAVRRLESMGPRSIVPSSAIRRAGVEAFAGAAFLSLSFVLALPLFGRAYESAWIALFPSSVHVEVLPGDTRVVAGQPLTIRAVVRVGGRVLSRFTPRLTVVSGSASRSVAMGSRGDGFEFVFDSVDRTFRYRVSAGSAASREHTITALYGPRVERIELRYEYPSFTNLQPRDEKNGGDIYGPAGTTVRVRVHVDKPIRSGALSLAGSPLTTLQPAAERVLEGTLVLSRDDSYRVALTDTDDLRSPGDTEYFIRVMDDRPPEVRIMRPMGDQQVTPLEEVAIEARADDDHGIERFELVYAVAGREPKVVPFSNATGTAAVKLGSHLLATEDLRVQPGDVITYYARARDVGRGKRPTETRSDMFFLEVRPFSEEFVSAQSQSGMGGEQIDGLIAAQKEIINATWSIERRAAAGAGRSTDDIGAIADAQAELKDRAEQIASRGGRGRTLRLPQQIPPPRQLRGTSGVDPVSTAIAAMALAVDRLQGRQTGDALTHEMAALQALLKAQSEIRRREVAQQGASAGGVGRQGQDLSALFDKELQRQQRTNYENRSQVETPSNQARESALDRIRELARRQEDLSRRQRDLARQTMSPEEMKRQLEKLTREQNELRERADEIAGQMARQETERTPDPTAKPGAGRSGEGAAGAGQASGDVRGASEQMRNAASDLQREDPSTAAERAERAAAQLRRLEERLRSDSAEGRQRAAGELRLEAQQIADEQRRIASEASRLEKGTRDGDAWRRLAGEKDKLAERVDELRRAAEQLAGSEQSRAGGAEGDAAARDARRRHAPDARATLHEADAPTRRRRSRTSNRPRARSRRRSPERRDGQRRRALANVDRDACAAGKTRSPGAAAARRGSEAARQPGTCDRSGPARRWRGRAAASPAVRARSAAHPRGALEARAKRPRLRPRRNDARGARVEHDRSRNRGVQAGLLEVGVAAERGRFGARTLRGVGRRPRRPAQPAGQVERGRQRSRARRLSQADRPLLRIARQEEVGGRVVREPASLVGAPGDRRSRGPRVVVRV
jgi:hypothetical protein